jgi:TonB family protein
MNADAIEAQPPADTKSPREGWGGSRWIFLITLAVTMHLAFVFLLGTKRAPAASAHGNVPEFNLANTTSELIALTDPTLFVLPHWNELSAATLREPPEIDSPSFHWTEPPQFLAPLTERYGVAFHTFMATNESGNSRLDFKPLAQMTFPAVKIESILPQNSTLEFSSELAQRRMLNNLAVPTLAYNDVIAPSRVQVLVGKDGNVASVVLLESSECEAADQKGLALARAVRFAPATGLTLGEITFNWHTVPATNAP